MDRAHRAKTTARKKYNDLAGIFIDLCELLRPPERLTVTQTAEKYVRLNNPGSYIGPYRVEVAPYMQEPADTLTSRQHSGLVFVGPAQTGKALALDTPIATPDGWTTMGEVPVGSWVYGDDGKPVRVVAASDVLTERRCYRVGFDDGSHIVADAEHLWAVRDQKDRTDQVVTTGTLLENGLRFFRVGGSGQSSLYRYTVQNAGALEVARIELPIDPYLLGCWLGDGGSYDSFLTLSALDADEIVDKIKRGPECTLEIRPLPKNTVGVRIDPIRSSSGAVRKALQATGLLSNVHRGDKASRKHIPATYLRASICQRTELLRGLMDTDGCCANGQCHFVTVLPRLADDVNELLVSLGYKVRRRVQTPSYSYKGEKRRGREAYTLTFVSYLDDRSPFHLQRKSAKRPPRDGNLPWVTERRKIIAIEEVPSVPVRCIGVDNASHLFLAGRQMVPTHNTESLILGWVAYSVKVDPMDMIVYNPTQAAARDFSMRRIDRLNRNSPEIGAVMLKNRDSNNTYDKRFRTGMILNLSWPTVTEFAGRPVGRIALTDYDRMPDDVEGDGNPYDLGSKRTTSFRSFAMTLAESSPSRQVENGKWIRATPHEAPPCKGILGLYNRGDRRRWYWPCPHCGAYFEGKWSQMSWDKHGTILDQAETARLDCPACGCQIEQDQRPGMQRWGCWLRDGQTIDEEGRIVGDGVRSTIASFWMNGIAAAFTTWTNLVVSYLNAMAQFEKTGSEEELKKFFNTDLGEPYLPKAAELERLPEVLKARAEALPIEEAEEPERVDRLTNRTFPVRPLVPPGVRFLVACVDVQANMFVVQVHGICPGDPFDVVVVDRFSVRKSLRRDEQGEHLWVKPGSYLEDWDEITSEVIRRTYKLSDGTERRMAIRYTVCDSGGQAGVTTNAYNYYRRLRQANEAGRFHLVKGDSLASRPRTQITFPDSNRRDKLAAARGDVPVMLCNANVLKDSLVNRLEVQVQGKGMFRFPDWLPDWWYNEMCAERRTEKGWEATNYRRNEGWDLSYYVLAACVSVVLRAEGIDWTRPPGWAEAWERNDLVIAPTATAAFTSRSEQAYDFEALGKVLA